ncbi:MAG: hypothetical protein K5841_00065 [Fretibacterium sp.]|nr:hypothetical protein [Fretibacterium sp.]
MANEFLTLMDLKNRMGPGDGAIASVAELLAQENELLNDIPWAQGNLVTGDVHFKRTAMPRATIRKINEGIEATASKTEAVTETCVLLTSRGIVDMAELDLAPSAEAYLLTENKPHIAAMGEDLCASMFYGTEATGFRGFAARLNRTANPQVIDAGGTGTNLASIYLVKWDQDEVTGIYPKNTTAGLKVMPQANIYVDDKDGKKFLAHVTEYSWFVGLKVRDDRYLSRVCNIDRDALLAEGDTAKTARQALFNQIIKAKNKVRHVDKGRVVMYADPDIFSILEIAAFEKANMALGYTDIGGDRRVLTFSGIPIKRNDCQSVPEKKVN